MMQLSKKISVVVPIYNVEEYLPRCLDSIIAQTYTNIEILLVDDGSPDNAGTICDTYADKDNRIHVFHIPNGGVAKARQLGVESSTGEYIVFVDPDDWLPLDSIEVLYSNMSDDVDIVIGSILTNESRVSIPSLEQKILARQQLIEVILDRIIIIGAPWCKLYRRHIFTCKSFPNVRRSQDWLMNLEVGFRVRKAVTIPNKVYNYCYYADSACHANFPDSEYWKNYVAIAYEIINRNNQFKNFEHDFYMMNMFIMFDCIKHNKYVSINDRWIHDTYTYFKGRQLPLKHRLVIFVLKSKIRQYCLYIFSRFYITLRKLFTF
ncbi:MAG: glycosyltransferase family 2 protein [Rikenellaceae bacterium]